MDESASSPEHHSPSLSLSLEPQSPGLPPERLLGRDAEINQLAADLEHSLDLKSVIKSGRRHINTEVILFIFFLLSFIQLSFKIEIK